MILDKRYVTYTMFSNNNFMLIFSFFHIRVRMILIKLFSTAEIFRNEFAHTPYLW